MKITLELPEYDGRATDVLWENDAAVCVRCAGQDVIISANRAGLIALAKQMLYLSDPAVPAGCHVHYDRLFLEEAPDSRPLIVEKCGDSRE